MGALQRVAVGSQAAMANRGAFTRITVVAAVAVKEGLALFPMQNGATAVFLTLRSQTASLRVAAGNRRARKTRHGASIPKAVPILAVTTDPVIRKLTHAHVKKAIILLTVRKNVKTVELTASVMKALAETAAAHADLAGLLARATSVIHQWPVITPTVAVVA